jgi:shikimate kinase/3-dehydroquinate synthase
VTPPIVLTGFMGAGKSTVGERLAEVLGRPFVDVDAVVEHEAGTTVAELFAREGESRFRELEAAASVRALRRDDAPVVALGGGALESAETRAMVQRVAFAAWLDVPTDVAFARTRAAAATRPLAGDEAEFAARSAARRTAYAATASAIVDATAEPGLAAAALAQSVWVREGISGRLGEVLAGRRSVLIADPAVAERVAHGQAATILVEGGEAAKTVASLERLWRGLAEAEATRATVVVCAGGGSLTDAGGLAAATFRRGLPWIALPTTVVGQVDASIGGKTGINVVAKNDVGAFWRPEVVLGDPQLLTTLPAAARADGVAEIVKTALLAGGVLWDLVQSEPLGDEVVRRCAGYKALVVAEDPTERGRRAVLNLGHTIGHGVEAAGGYGAFSHGQAVAVGLSAALWLSQRLRGLAPEVAAAAERLLADAGLPLRAPGLEVDAVLDAMRHDKKRVGAAHRLVLLEAPGRPVRGVDVREDVLREAVERALRIEG